MAKTFKWTISKVEAVPQLGEFSNVVTDIHYRRVVTDENGDSTDIYDVANMPAPGEGDPFIPADQLTYDDYYAMLEKHLDVERIDDLLLQRYKIIFEPEKIELPLPPLEAPQEEAEPEVQI